VSTLTFDLSFYINLSHENLIFDRVWGRWVAQGMLWERQ